MFERLTAVASALRSEIVAEMPDARLEEDFGSLQRGIEMLEAERLRRLAEIERRGLHQRDGHLSAVSWLATAHGMSRGTAARHVRVARALDAMPKTRDAFDEGAVSLCAVKLLAAARQVDPEAFDLSEGTLVDAARTHSAGDLNRVLGY